jgi:hypothetical protein
MINNQKAGLIMKIDKIVLVVFLGIQCLTHAAENKGRVIFDASNPNKDILKKDDLTTIYDTRTGKITAYRTSSFINKYGHSLNIPLVVENENSYELYTRLLDEYEAQRKPQFGPTEKSLSEKHPKGFFETVQEFAFVDEANENENY